MFTTEHLLLRNFQDSDLDHLLALRNDVFVVRGKTFGPIVPRPPAFKQVLRSIVEESLVWFTLADKDTGEFVGHCALRVVEMGPVSVTPRTPTSNGSLSVGSGTSAKNRDEEFSISLKHEKWGMGMGTEATRFMIGHAFAALGLHRVSLVVSEGNLAARALYAKIGFQEEGRKRRGNWADGRWEDIIYMGILEDEWTAMQSGSGAA